MFPLIVLEAHEHRDSIKTWDPNTNEIEILKEFEKRECPGITVHEKEIFYTEKNSICSISPKQKNPKRITQIKDDPDSSFYGLNISKNGKIFVTSKCIDKGSQGFYPEDVIIIDRKNNSYKIRAHNPGCFNISNKGGSITYLEKERVQWLIKTKSETNDLMYKKILEGELDPQFNLSENGKILCQSYKKGSSNFIENTIIKPDTIIQNTKLKDLDTIGLKEKELPEIKELIKQLKYIPIQEHSYMKSDEELAFPTLSKNGSQVYFLRRNKDVNTVERVDVSGIKQPEVLLKEKDLIKNISRIPNGNLLIYKTDEILTILDPNSKKVTRYTGVGKSSHREFSNDCNYCFYKNESNVLEIVNLENKKIEYIQPGTPHYFIGFLQK